MASLQGREGLPGTLSLSPQPACLQCPASWAAQCNKPQGVLPGPYQKCRPILGLPQHLCIKHHSLEHLPPRQVSIMFLEGPYWRSGPCQRSLPTGDLMPRGEGAVAPPWPRGLPPGRKLPAAWGAVARSGTSALPLLCPDRQLGAPTRDRVGSRPWSQSSAGSWHSWAAARGSRGLLPVGQRSLVPAVHGRMHRLQGSTGTSPGSTHPVPGHWWFGSLCPPSP